MRMLTPEGHTAVKAAHIIPWAVSHNDDRATARQPLDGRSMIRPANADYWPRRTPLILKTSSIYCRIQSRHYKAANLKKSWQQV